MKSTSKLDNRRASGAMVYSFIWNETCNLLWDVVNKQNKQITLLLVYLWVYKYLFSSPVQYHEYKNTHKSLTYY